MRYTNLQIPCVTFQFPNCALREVCAEPLFIATSFWKMPQSISYVTNKQKRLSWMNSIKSLQCHQRPSKTIVKCQFKSKTGLNYWFFLVHWQFWRKNQKNQLSSNQNYMFFKILAYYKSWQNHHLSLNFSFCFQSLKKLKAKKMKD